MINDQYILDKFLDKNCNANKRKLQKSYLTEEEYNYLINRFKDAKTLSEVIYRIKFNIENLPKCPVCGKPLNFIKPSKHFQKYCSNKCKNNSIEHNNLIKLTLLKNYGVDNPQKSSEILKKSKATKLLKYNDENYNNREKYKQTCLKKFGVYSPLCNGNLRELGKNTLLKNMELIILVKLKNKY